MRPGKSYLTLYGLQPGEAGTALGQGGQGAPRKGASRACETVPRELDFQAGLTLHCPTDALLDPGTIGTARGEPPLFHYTATLPLAFFLTPYLRDLLRRGRVYALSRGARIDGEDVVALLPSGQLLLSLTRDTYQSFGITGRPCAPGMPRRGEGRASAAARFLVTVDLIGDPAYLPGGKKFARLQWCLEHTLTRPFAFWLSFLAPAPGHGDANQPQGLAGLCLDLPPHPPPCVQDLQKHPLSWSTHTRMCRAPDLYGMLGEELPTAEERVASQGKRPRSPRSEEPPISLARAWSETLEWVGMLGVQADRLRVHDQVDPFVSAYTVPGRAGPATKSITTLRLDGFLPGPLAQGWIAHVLAAISPMPTSTWWAVTGHGMRDCPISWRRKEHGYLVSGENDYTLLQVYGTLAVLQTLGPHDAYQI